jgi:hypothetical protein
MRVTLGAGRAGGWRLRLLLDLGRRNRHRLGRHLTDRPHGGLTMQINPYCCYNQTSGSRCTEDRYWRKPRPPDWSRHWCSSRRWFLGYKNYFPAAVTIRKMRKAPEPLVLGQHTFEERVERIGVEMRPGM